MPLNSYRDLKVWQKSMDLTFMVYKLVKFLPREELYALSDQMRRAVVSIPSNIAEGRQRGTVNEYKHYLYVAKGSLSELETQLMICEGLGYLGKEQIEPAMSLCAEISRMLTTLIQNLPIGGSKQVINNRLSGNNS